MNKITIHLGNHKLDEILLERGTLSLGRAEDNDINLSDPATSSHHAKIVTIFSSSFIQDLCSTNGTYVNGKKIERHSLHNGDIIVIGNLQLRFHSDLDSAKSEAENKARVISQEELANLRASVHTSPAEASPAQEQRVEEAAEPEMRSGSFSIIIPDNTGPINSADNPAEPVPEPEVPRLDSTLPLDELRKNPRRTVIVKPHNNSLSRVRQHARDKQRDVTPQALQEHNPPAPAHVETEPAAPAVDADSLDPAFSKTLQRDTRTLLMYFGGILVTLLLTMLIVYML